MATAPGFIPPVTTPPTPGIAPPVTSVAPTITEGVDTQALTAAFAFGIVVNAAVAAAFLMVKGRTTSLKKDGQRLALTLFLISAALWAQIDFIATAVNPSSFSGCQVALTFASAFDQLARVFILQYFLWASAGAAKTSVQRFVPQGLLLARLALGGVFVGMQRPEFNPVCVPTSQLLPVAIATIAVDGVVFLTCVVRAFSDGGLPSIKEDGAPREKARGVKLAMAGFALWMGTSVPMHLGISAIALVLRTALPAATLAILVGIIAGFSDSLTINHTRPMSFPPEAPSPRRMTITRDLQTRDIQIQSRNLSTPDSDYPPSRYEDLKAGEIVSISAFPLPPSRDGPNENPKDETLPSIIPAIPGQAITGVGGFPVQGQLFPPMRAETTPVSKGPDVSAARANSVRPKKGLFDLGKGPTSGLAAGRLAISGPILQEAGEQNPLNKIATVDLATAARNEKERRDQAHLQRDSGLIATRPAPQPPAITPEEAMRRAQSFKRKEIASVPPSQDPDVPQALERESFDETTAVTTATEPSLKPEELRRRSPRLVPQRISTAGQQFTDPRAAPQPDRKTGPPQRPPRPESLNIDTDQPSTRPAPQQPQAAAVPSPTVTPPALGAAPAVPSRQEPTSVAKPMQPQPVVEPSILGSSPKLQPLQTTRQSPPLPATSENTRSPSSPPRATSQNAEPRISMLPRTGSVKTNIRPSRQRPPSIEEVHSPEKPAVQRRVAAGLPGNPKALAMRKLLNQAETQRQQTVMFVNNIEYSDPAAVRNILEGAAKKAAQNAPESVEQLQRAPSVLHRPRPIPRNRVEEELPSPREEATTPDTASGHQRNKSNASASTKKSILKSTPGSPTQLPPLPPAPKRPGDPMRPLPNDTKSMTFNEKMEIFFPAPPGSSGSNAGGVTAPSSRFSPIPALPPFPASFLDVDESERDKSDRTTKTSFQTQSIVEITDIRRRQPLGAPNTAKFSVDTETTAAVSQAWLPAIPNTQKLSISGFEGAKRQSSPVIPLIPDGISEVSDIRSLEVGQSKEVMTIMLDESIEPRSRRVERDSWFTGGHLALGGLNSEGKRESHWHHRVGDACPTFSDRKEKTKSRKMVPPTPLLLGAAARKNTVIVRAAEPSPLESPTDAYRDIQTRLNKLDESASNSNRNNNDNTRESIGSEGRKRELLDNLEREMGMQEDYWHEMQNGISRDSLSTVRTSPRRESVYEPVTRGRSGVNRGSLLKPNAVAQVPVMSPTPPESEESDIDLDDFQPPPIMSKKVQPRLITTGPKLWRPRQVVAPSASVNLLWAPAPTIMARQPMESIAARYASDMAPLLRKSMKRFDPHEHDNIHSSDLWQKPRRPQSSSSRLWGTTAPVPPQKPQRTPSRSAAQRPSRRSRRMTYLPDIVESPQPLPDNRGTLGIFQFPWGEKSDMATVIGGSGGGRGPSYMFMAMPGTMTTGGPAVTAALEARSKQLEGQEYSSSFFDVYDDEDGDEGDEEGGDSDGFNMDDSDEDFDETTLWEIASLLKTDKVPSKLSLLPMSTSDSQQGGRVGSSIIDDYMGDEAEAKSKGDSVAAGLDDGVLPLSGRNSSLWVKPARARGSGVGLPQPDESTWRRYIPAYDAPMQVSSRREEPALIYSKTLWKAEQSVSRDELSLLWSLPKVAKSTKPVMWSPPSWAEAGEPSGLFNLAHKRRDYRTTAKEPAALHIERKIVRVQNEPLSELSSSALWSAGSSLAKQHDWITMGGGKQGKSPRREHISRAASLAEWEAALHEAVAASYSAKNAWKPTHASPAEWTAALDEAIAWSSIHLADKTSSQQHAPTLVGLWAISSARTHTNASGLWHPHKHGRLHLPIGDSIAASGTTNYKRRNPDDTRLPVFLWQTMWRASDVQKQERKNWLCPTVKKEVRGVQFRY